MLSLHDRLETWLSVDSYVGLYPRGFFNDGKSFLHNTFTDDGKPTLVRSLLSNPNERKVIVPSGVDTQLCRISPDDKSILVGIDIDGSEMTTFVRVDAEKGANSLEDLRKNAFRLYYTRWAEMAISCSTSARCRTAA